MRFGTTTRSKNSLSSVVSAALWLFRFTFWSFIRRQGGNYCLSLAPNFGGSFSRHTYLFHFRFQHSECFPLEPHAEPVL